MDPNVERLVAEQIMRAAEAAEAQVDQELQNLEKMTCDDLDKVREQRIQAMRAKSKQVQEWERQGHGQYDEVPEEKEFFNVCKKSNRVVCHFYRSSTMRCDIVDKHLKLIAPKHKETKFCKINAEKCPFLVEKLTVKVLPTILLLKDSRVVDRIVGFTDLGNRDEFATDVLEKRLALNQVIDYNDEIELPKPKNHQMKIIRGKGDA